MSFVDFVVLPPGHGRSVTDFWGLDAHEAQLRCPDDVWETQILITTIYECTHVYTGVYIVASYCEVCGVNFVIFVLSFLHKYGLNPYPAYVDNRMSS